MIMVDILPILAHKALNVGFIFYTFFTYLSLLPEVVKNEKIVDYDKPLVEKIYGGVILFSIISLLTALDIFYKIFAMPILEKLKIIFSTIAVPIVVVSSRLVTGVREKRFKFVIIFFANLSIITLITLIGLSYEHTKFISIFLLVLSLFYFSETLSFFYTAKKEKPKKSLNIIFFINTLFVGVSIPEISIHIPNLPEFSLDVEETFKNFAVTICIATILYSLIRDLIIEHKNFRSNLDRFLKDIKLSKRLYNDFVVFLISILEARDVYTKGHSERVMRYSYRLARKIYKNTYMPNFIATGALLHDIGKVGIKDEVLLKPSKLSESEMKEMKKHPLIGKNLLDTVDFFKETSDIALLHHERIDGKGYPFGLVGKDIPDYVKIVAISDSFDAMFSERVYKTKMTIEEIKKEIKNEKNKQFDGKISEIFIKHMSEIVNI